MMGKILFLAGAATGYVLGSKAGRQAYDQIKGKAQDLWGDPNVQKVVSQAGQAAKDAATVAQSKISGAAKDAKNGSSDESSTAGAAGSADASSMTDVPDISTSYSEDGFQEEIPVAPPTTFGAPGTPGSSNPPA